MFPGLPSHKDEFSPFFLSFGIFLITSCHQLQKGVAADLRNKGSQAQFFEDNQPHYLCEDTRN
jgi:hypothetical protein